MNSPHQPAPEPRLGIAGRIARAFIDSKLTPLIVIASMLLGVFAVLMLPREEEPQIKVPMVDVLVSMPGFSAKEVEERATRPDGKAALGNSRRGIHLLHLAARARALAIVRFKVGEDMETQPGEAEPEAASQLRQNPARRFPPAHQGVVH